MTTPIRFDDGGAYDRYMGQWSQLAGHAFLDWLAPPPGLRWLDVGCGNGAFTGLILERAAPGSVDGIDLSEAQLAYARSQSGLRMVRFHHGDAMGLPFGNTIFDVAVMPLVIFFVPVPHRGVAEMVRVTAPGGLVAAYAWDMPGGGFPYDALFAEMREMALEVPEAPNPDASRVDQLHELWTTAGLTSVSTREISVQRTFAGFDDFWATILGAPSVGAILRGLPHARGGDLQTRLRTKLPRAADGSITYSARANAVKGRVPR